MNQINTQDPYKALSTVISSDYPEILREMVETIFDALKTFPEFQQENETRCAQLAFEITEQLRRQFSGSQFYFPKGNSYVVNMRAQEIYDDFTGNNHAELVRKYGLSEVRIRQIIEQVKKIRFEQSQGRLNLETL